MTADLPPSGLREALEEFEEEGGGRERGRGRPARARKKKPAGGTIEGVVVARSRGLYEVDAPGGRASCSLRGRLRGGDEPVAGDRVRVRLGRGGQGVLEEVLARTNALTRVSEERPEAVHTIAANIDWLVMILAADPAPPRWALADRLLVISELEGFEAILVINKIDLAPPGSAARAEVERGEAIYRAIGVPVILASAREGTGLEELRRHLGGRLSVLAGHSGVGKSSLINALAPELGLAVGEVNPMTGKGRHTTSATRLLALPSGGYIADTPGFREFGLGRVQPEHLGRYYREFRPIIGRCRFPDCRHLQEPECALRAAVDRGEVSALRFRNYCQILAGLTGG